MAEIARSVITALENLDDAKAMSVFPEGNGEQFTFAGRATTNSTGYSATATHCWSSGYVDESIINAYEADNRFFVSTKVGRLAKLALAEHVPQLYPWLGAVAP